MANGPGSTSQGEQNVLIGGIFLVLLVALAYFFPFPFSWCWHWMARGEVAVLDWIAPILPYSTQRALTVIGTGLQHNAPGTLGWSTIFKSEMALAPFSGILYALPIAAIVAWFWRHSEPHHRRHTTESLIEVETRVWRSQRIFVKRDPTRESPDITKGPWRISESPEEFARRTGALILTLGQPNAFDPQPARGPLRHQLGPRFTQLATMTRYEQWTAAPMLLRADGQKQDSDQLLGDISYCFAEELSERHVDQAVRAVLKHYAQHEITERLRRQHAYVRTWIMGLFLEARACGKFSTSRIPWLQLVDRTLFFALNNVGRAGYHMEGLAPAIHYFAEVKNGFALREPTDTLAAESVRRALINEGVLDRPIDDPNLQPLQPPASARVVGTGRASGGGPRPAAEEAQAALNKFANAFGDDSMVIFGASQPPPGPAGQ